LILLKNLWHWNFALFWLLHRQALFALGNRGRRRFLLARQASNN
jgi:hypothetical protein